MKRQKNSNVKEIKRNILQIDGRGQVDAYTIPAQEKVSLEAQQNTKSTTINSPSDAWFKDAQMKVMTEL